MEELNKVDKFKYLVRPQTKHTHEDKEKINKSFEKFFHSQINNKFFQNELERLKLVIIKGNSKSAYLTNKEKLKLGFLRPIEAWVKLNFNIKYSFNQKLHYSLKMEGITHFIPISDRDGWSLLRCAAIFIVGSLYLMGIPELYRFLYVKAFEHYEDQKNELSINMLNLLAAMSLFVQSGESSQLAFMAILYNNTLIDEYIIYVLLLLILDFTRDESNVSKQFEDHLKFTSFYPESLQIIRNLPLHDSVKYLIEHRDSININDLMIRLIAYSLNLNIKILNVIDDELHIEDVLQESNQVLILIKKGQSYDIGLSYDFMEKYKNHIRYWIDSTPVEMIPSSSISEILTKKPKKRFDNQFCMECEFAYTLRVKLSIAKENSSMQNPETVFFSKCKSCILSNIETIIFSNIEAKSSNINYREFAVRMLFVAVSKHSKERFSREMKLKEVFSCLDESLSQFLKKFHKDKCTHCSIADSAIELSCCNFCKQCFNILLSRVKDRKCLCNDQLSTVDLVKLHFLQAINNQCCSCELYDFGLRKASISGMLKISNKKLGMRLSSEFNHFICLPCHQKYPKELNCKICEAIHNYELDCI